MNEACYNTIIKLFVPTESLLFLAGLVPIYNTRSNTLAFHGPFIRKKSSSSHHTSFRRAQLLRRCCTRSIGGDRRNNESQKWQKIWRGAVIFNNIVRESSAWHSPRIT